MPIPFRQIRATYDDRTVTVYQAYSPAIAVPAVRAGRFVPPFKRERMTWIKPSFLWMMYRCGWALKEGQEHVLAISITRDGFEWALANSTLSHGTGPDWAKQLKASPVRIQWDPERDLHLNELPYRSLQVGLGGAAVGPYVDEWITGIADVTDQARQIHELIRAGDDAAATALLPVERPYPLSDELAERLGAQPQPKP